MNISVPSDEDPPLPRPRLQARVCVFKGLVACCMSWWWWCWWCATGGRRYCTVTIKSPASGGEWKWALVGVFFALFCFSLFLLFFIFFIAIVSQWSRQIHQKKKKITHESFTRLSFFFCGVWNQQQQQQQKTLWNGPYVYMCMYTGRQSVRSVNRFTYKPTR